MNRDAEFVRETRASLQQLTSGLLELEREGLTRDRLDELFRTAHTLKGNCGMAGLDGASRLAHAVEELLSELRDGSLAPTPPLIDASLAALDDINAMVVEWHEDETVTTDPSPSVSTLRDAMHRHRDDPGVEDERQPPTDDGPARPESDATPTVDVGFDLTEDEVDAVGDELDLTGDEVGLAEDEFETGDDPFDLTEDELDAGDDAFGLTGAGVDRTDDEFDPAVVDALDSASGFDDLEALLAELDEPDVRDDEDEARWGAFDSVEPDDSEDAGDADRTRSDGRLAGRSARPEEIDASSEPMAEFDTIKGGVEQDDISSLDGELVDVEFGEFDDDDELSIQDLLDGEVAGTDATSGAVDRIDDGADEERPADSSDVPRSFDVDDETSLDDVGSELTASGVTDVSEGREPSNDATSADTAGPDDVTSADTVEPESAGGVDAAIAEPDEGASADTADSESGAGADTTEPKSAVGADTTEPGDVGSTDTAEPDEVESTDREEENPFVQADLVDEAETDEPASERVTSTDRGDDEAVVGADEPVQPTDPFEPSDDPATGESVEAASDSTDDPADGPDIDFAGGDSSHPDRVDAKTDDEPEIDLSDVLREEPETDPDVGGDAPAGLPDIDELGASVTDDVPVAHEPTPDVSFQRDRHTVEFESRFAERFGTTPDGESEPLVQTASSTIEESCLDTNRYQSSSAVESPPGEVGATPTTQVGSITVDVQNADTLLNLVDELSLAQLRLREADENERDDHLSTLESVTAELRRTVMDLRLMPLSTVDVGLPRIVRDVAREQGKRVAFEVSDEGVNLDRGIIEKLGDPLVHLVRNAVDHGIESPRERKRKDKPPEGTIELRAWRDRDRAVIEIEDDGRGISTDRLRQHAVETGLRSRIGVEKLSQDEVYDLVFEPGFSTAAEVTDVSGRGVGMDAVKRTINSLDGTVSIESEPDVGTTIRIGLPVSVAVSKMLFVEVGSERYAMPASVVNDVEGVDEEALTGDGRIAVEWPDESVDRPDYVPLRSVREAFDVRDGGVDSTNRVEDQRVVVRLEPDTRELALLCDGVDDAREVVVKPYEGLLGDVPGISGATMSEDGSLVNIIEVTSI
ncbi:ATP-binding protein [Salinigranum salinum]|uniref:ATP-binding protein n=1 Tax=Salinigranum salinum TaxID=1364937 RepID=UPI0012607663|nr:ATP-binding protein [Salinigranum salinum]